MNNYELTLKLHSFKMEAFSCHKYLLHLFWSRFYVIQMYFIVFAKQFPSSLGITGQPILNFSVMYWQNFLTFLIYLLFWCPTTQIMDIKLEFYSFLRANIVLFKNHVQTWKKSKFSKIYAKYNPGNNFIMKVEVQPITGQKVVWKICSWPTPEGKIQKNYEK
jgi:hypothetical protein